MDTTNVKARTASFETTIDMFISVVNWGIRQNRLFLNDSITKIPYLTEIEFERAQKAISKIGYLVSRESDKFKSTSYKIEKIITHGNLTKKKRRKVY